jgi:hypothetical protein
MKYTIVFFALMAITLFSACEGGTTFSKRIENRSSETIKVKLFTVFGPADETTILPNESKQIFWYDKMGLFVDEAYTCVQLIDSIELEITNNYSLVKDIMNPDYWERVSKGGRNSTEDCVFVISSDDLQ